MKIDIRKGIKTLNNDFKVSTRMIRLILKKEEKLPQSSTIAEKEANLNYIKQKQTELSENLSYENFCSMLRANIAIASIISLSDLIILNSVDNYLMVLQLSANGFFGLAGTKKSGDYSLMQYKLENELEKLRREKTNTK